MRLYNLYHVARPTAAEAREEFKAVAGAVHHLGGALWTSLADGPDSSYVVIALPLDQTLDALEGLEPVAVVSQKIFGQIDLDPDFMPLEEEPSDDEQSPVAG